MTFSVGKSHIFLTPEKRASSGTDVININIPVGHGGSHVAYISSPQDSVKTLQGTQCPSVTTSDTGLHHRNSDGFSEAHLHKLSGFKHNFFLIKADQTRMYSLTVWLCFSCIRIHFEWMVQELGGWYVLEMVDIWPHSEARWSLLRETWSCSVTAWRLTLTSKVKTSVFLLNWSSGLLQCIKEKHCAARWSVFTCLLLLATLIVNIGKGQHFGKYTYKTDTTLLYTKH